MDIGKQSGGSSLSLMTEKTATGTFVDFDVPAGAKRVTVMYFGLSTNGTSDIVVQLGTSSGVETTGYVSRSSAIANTVSTSSSTAGFFNFTANAGAASYGSIILTKIGNHKFVCSGVFGRSDVTLTGTTGGGKSLSSELTKVRVVTVNGTDTFDAGTINVLIEG